MQAGGECCKKHEEEEGGGLPLFEFSAEDVALCRSRATGWEESHHSEVRSESAFHLHIANPFQILVTHSYSMCIAVSVISC